MKAEMGFNQELVRNQICLNLTDMAERFGMSRTEVVLAVRSEDYVGPEEFLISIAEINDLSRFYQ